MRWAARLKSRLHREKRAIVPIKHVIVFVSRLLNKFSGLESESNDYRIHTDSYERLIAVLQSSQDPARLESVGKM